ncbi:MAG: hypothetical protein V1721_09020 [Pseudomonadota bacterium]
MNSANQKPLAQKFNELAAAAHKAFPEKLKNLVVFLLPSSEIPVYVAPEIADHLAKNIAAVKKDVEEAANHLRTHRAEGTTVACPLAEAVVTLIALNENPQDSFSCRYTKEMGVTANFDHEIGHRVVENGFPSGTVSEHLAECAATAYAALRHIQQFGRKTDFLEYYNFSHTVVLGLSPKHYTDDVVQRVKQLAEETDISGLSLRETAELAGKIALECRLDDKTLEKIRKAFLPAAEACKKAGGICAAVLQKCIEVTREHTNDPDIYKAGERFLNYPDNKKYLKNEAKTGPYWRNALDFIKNHQTKPFIKRSVPAFPALS